MTRTREKARTIRLLRAPSAEGPGIFCITSKKQSTYYVFQEIPCEIGGRGFALHRLGLGTLYHTRVGARHECSCECMGFLAHGHCKHIQGLLILMKHGLDAAHLRAENLDRPVEGEAS